MRKLILGAVLASSALASPALARDDSWYVELDAGVVLVDDFHLPLDHASNAFQYSSGTEVAQIDSAAGYDIGTVLGYDFGMFRLEGEVSYRRAEATQIRSAFGRSGFAALTSPYGKVSSLTGMVNGLVEIGDDDGLQLYAGGGVGYGRVNLQGSGAASSVDTVPLVARATVAARMASYFSASSTR